MKLVSNRSFTALPAAQRSTSPGEPPPRLTPRAPCQPAHPAVRGKRRPVPGPGRSLALRWLQRADTLPPGSPRHAEYLRSPERGNVQTELTNPLSGLDRAPRDVNTERKQPLVQWHRAASGCGARCSGIIPRLQPLVHPRGCPPSPDPAGPRGSHPWPVQPAARRARRAPLE